MSLPEPPREPEADADNADARIAHGLERAAPQAWRRPGFERPLAGLLLYITALLALAGPYLYLTALLIPARVQPFPAVDGALGTVEELLLLGWAIADFGTTTAIVRAVAGLRATRPAALLAHLRLLVRWQLVIALGLTTLGLALAPSLAHSRYAPLAHALLLRSLTAPLLVFAAVPALCEALQRYDRQLLLELLDRRLLAVLLPIPLVLWLRAGAAESEAPLRALEGLVAGQALATLVTGLVGLSLLRGLGLPLRTLLVGALPSREERRALLRFGAGIMSGKAIFFLAGLVELGLVVERLHDYPRWLGIKAIVLGRLLSPLWLLWPFCESAIPSLAEALATGRRALAQSYVARYLQHGHLFVATLFGLVLGAAPPLLLARLSPPWHAAAALLPVAGAIGLLLPLCWIGDALQRAHGHSATNAAFLLGEQLLRLGLLVVLLPRLGLLGLFVAMLAAGLVKTAAVLLHAHRLLLPLSLPLRAVFLAPAAAGVAIAIGSRLGMRLALAQGGNFLPAASFVLLAFVAFPTAFFLIGLAGGLEPAALRELEEAALMVPLRRLSNPFLLVLTGAARLGARLGPEQADRPLTVRARAERDQLLSELRPADEMH